MKVLFLGFYLLRLSAMLFFLFFSFSFYARMSVNTNINANGMVGEASLDLLYGKPVCTN